jgi:hypothetical protein
MLTMRRKRRAGKRKEGCRVFSFTLLPTFCLCKDVYPSSVREEYVDAFIAYLATLLGSLIP